MGWVDAAFHAFPPGAIWREAVITPRRPEPEALYAALEIDQVAAQALAAKGEGDVLSDGHGVKQGS